MRYYLVIGFVILEIILNKTYNVVNNNVWFNVMSFNRKLIRNGNGWALCLNSTILEFLGVDPTVNMVEYTIENDRLVITKSEKLVEQRDKKAK